MKRPFLPVLLALAVAAAPVLAGEASKKPSQSSLASKTAQFGTVSKADHQYQQALDAKDLKAAVKLVGKTGAFKGTIAKVFAPESGNLVILNFADDYKTALTAVIKKEDFSRFPDLQTLKGKPVLVSGKFIDYKGQPEVALTGPEQIKTIFLKPHQEGFAPPSSQLPCRNAASRAAAGSHTGCQPARLAAGGYRRSATTCNALHRPVGRPEF